VIVSRPARVGFLDAARKILAANRVGPRPRTFKSTADPGGDVVYPVSAGEVVGERSANLFVTELIKSAKVQGLSFKEVFRRVSTSVAQATRDQQIPWESSPSPENLVISLTRKLGRNTGLRRLVRRSGRTGVLGYDQGQRQRG